MKAQILYTKDSDVVWKPIFRIVYKEFRCSMKAHILFTNGSYLVWQAYVCNTGISLTKNGKVGWYIRYRIRGSGWEAKRYCRYIEQGYRPRVNWVPVSAAESDSSGWAVRMVGKRRRGCMGGKNCIVYPITDWQSGYLASACGCPDVDRQWGASPSSRYSTWRISGRGRSGKGGEGWILPTRETGATLPGHGVYSWKILTAMQDFYHPDCISCYKANVYLKRFKIQNF
jgi:hypothetical protein